MMEAPRSVVVVGGGLAAHRAAGALAAHPAAVRVTVVGAEAHAPYDRPPLSKAILAGTAADDTSALRADDLEGVRWRLGTAATGLDPDRRVVLLDGGEELPYDGLVVATGRRARPLPSAAGLRGVHTLRTLDDARALRAAAATATGALIVGAGFVGCEVAATLRGARPDLPVTVVDVAERPMPVLGPLVGDRAAALHAERGVDLRLGCGLTGLTAGEDGHVRAADLDDGTTVAADLVLVAVGSLPNSEWLDASGLDRDRGAVVCDRHGFARGHADIVACGDVAAWPHPATEGAVSVEHWSSAQAMGGIAARNLLAEDPSGRETHDAFPTFWSDQYDVKLQSVGFIGAADRHEIVLEDPAKGVLVVEAHAGDALVGAIAVNRPRAMLQYHQRLRAELAARV